MRAWNQALMRWKPVTNGVNQNRRTHSTRHPGTWDGKKGKVSLPDLNKKSTANDAWIWCTDAEQYLRDGSSPRVVKAEMLQLARSLMNGCDT